MTDISNIESLIKLSKGKYSYNDYKKVKRLFEDSSTYDDISEQLLSHWDELIQEFHGKDKSLNHIFEKIQNRILLEDRKQAKKIGLWQYYRKVAAVLLIPVLVFSIWHVYTHSENQNRISGQVASGWVSITAPEGARVEFMLPDSSRGWLNSNSKLKYPSIFENQRKVELSGEAWFDVKHVDASEFIVSVPEMDIKVLGTQFNVSAYTDDIFTDVTLERGKVEVTGKSAVFKQTLSPNQKIFFNHQSKTVTLGEVDAGRYSAWKDGYLIIDNEPLGQVINRLERWYNVKIDIQDETLRKYRFKATFKDEPLEEVLKLMAKTTPMTYNIEERKADNQGTYYQKKITMKLKQ